ncbi:glycosyltransferase family 39 protein [Haoranjiania flava]|uniref:Glycosyltransferase family 39 protein n=1 Tax=Haoranjiania flava TaxID=1856322 RepID=A0AAE3LIY4_9BACT|nr:glycosyltransferase family 39 protein [Haoranjiania flava]MCU7693073.1 glycosyltransferase family 39 protein [Haoranjiania flava]
MNLQASSYKHKVFWLIAATFIARCILAAMVELGNDEVYYYTYALQPDWNHFDHPPMVGLLIRFFTLNQHWLSELSMRLGAIVCAGIATWLIYCCGKLIRNERTGWMAAILYNLSVYTGIIAGLFILPDSPQVVFWLGALYCILALVKMPQTPGANRWLLLFGLLAGLTIISKIHGIFLWLGFGAYILLHDRKWLRNPYLYVAVLISCIVVSPVLFWNIRYDFITFRFHGERVEVKQFAVDINSFLQTFFGQILYNNPLNIILYAAAFFGLKKSGMPANIRNMLLWFSLPIIIVTTGVSLFRSTLPHWSGPGFIALMLMTAYVADAVAARRKSFYFTGLKISAAVIVVALVAGVAAINFYPGTLNPNKDIKKHGQYDFTLDMSGWRSFGKAFEEVYKADLRSGIIKPGTPVLLENWFPAAHILFYVNKGNNIPFKSVGSLNRLHKFAWLNLGKENIKQGQNAYFIASSNYFIDPAELYGNDFSRIKLSKVLASKRGGKTTRYFFIYHLLDARKELLLTLPVVEKSAD